MSATSSTSPDASAPAPFPWFFLMCAATLFVLPPPFFFPMVKVGVSLSKAMSVVGNIAPTVWMEERGNVFGSYTPNASACLLKCNMYPIPQTRFLWWIAVLPRKLFFPRRLGSSPRRSARCWATAVLRVGRLFRGNEALRISSSPADDPKIPNTVLRCH